MERSRPTSPAQERTRQQQADRKIMCRSCGKRPGLPTAIIGQLMQAELCELCAKLRKERIRSNRAAARGGPPRR